MRAIDVHVHCPIEEGGPGPKMEEVAAEYAELDIFGNILARDARTIVGRVETSNDYVAAIVKKYPDRFMGTASVDPWMGKLAIYECERAVKELGLKGFKFEPYRQEFYLNEPRFRPLWAKIEELGVPIMVHTGMAQFQGGHRMKYLAPFPYFDDLASDFPGLTIIGCHQAFPWQDEMLAIATHKPNVYIELSAWWPHEASSALIEYTNKYLKDKVMFGTGYARIHPKPWIEDFDKQAFSAEVRPKVLMETARKVFCV